jgi:signal transduction histidine kinase
MGLIGMRKRVESLGGIFTLENKVNGGARVAGTFPLPGGMATDG